LSGVVTEGSERKIK